MKTNNTKVFYFSKLNTVTLGQVEIQGSFGFLGSSTVWAVVEEGVGEVP